MPFKGLVSVIFVLGAIACGSITMSIDTEVKGADDIVHTLSVEAEGAVADMVNELGDFDTSQIPGSCEVVQGDEMFSFKCERLPHTELGFLSEGEEEFISVSVTDTPEFVEYTASMPNTFVDPDQEAELQDNPLADSIDDIIKFRLYWNVSMPGDFVDSASNADSYEDGVASFTVTLEDERDAFTVVSRQKKGGGLFSCNR